MGHRVDLEVVGGGGLETGPVQAGGLVFLLGDATLGYGVAMPKKN